MISVNIFGSSQQVIFLSYAASVSSTPLHYCSASESSAFIFLLSICFLAFLSRVTLLCLFKKKKKKIYQVFVTGAYIYHDGVWKMWSMILYIYIF